MTPVNWLEGDLTNSLQLYVTGLIFGSVLTGGALLTAYKGIKPHFTFTYLNFGILIYLVSGVSGIFADELSFLYIALTFIGSGATAYYAYRQRQFIFLLYAFLAAYIAFTTLLFMLQLLDFDAVLFAYFLISCGGFIFFIIAARKYFKEQP